MIAMASQDGICILEFLNGRTTPSAARAFARRLGATVFAGRRRHPERVTRRHPERSEGSRTISGSRRPGTSRHIERLQRELDAYFSGRLRRFGVPLDLRGTPFQKSVWSRLLRVPYGATRSYARIAATIGKPAAFRAVGHANGRNPVSIVVPCHRLIGSAGALRGYGGGLWRKQWLIAHERGESPRKTQSRG